ncbi:MAG: hypothetical protein RI953_673 [Pseudomonadota bacterium]|jgi:hypothetical protein
MGDASHTGSTNKSRFRSQLIVEGQPPRLPSDDSPPEADRISILYTHADDNSGLGLVPNGGAACRSLEELLSYLESDLVDTLWFDDSVSAQERSYITGWARIFRPGVTTQQIQQKIAN